MTDVDLALVSRVLGIRLSLAVPGAITRPLPTPNERAALVDTLTARSDQLMFGSDDDGEIFAALVAAVATTLANCPGGLTALGVHFCDPHHRGCTDPTCPKAPQRG
jgi:hypothetical protein